MNKKRGVALLAVVLTAVFGAFIIQKTFAATGSIFVSPSSTSVTKGSNFTVGIRINPGAATDGVEATLAYDQSKLQYVSMESGASPYTIQLTGSGGNGTVQVARGILGGTVSANNSLVVNVTFKALVGGTTAALNLTAGNSTSGGAYNDPGLADGAVTLKNPVTTTPKPPSPPTTSPTQPKPSTGSGGTSSGSGSTSGGSNTGTSTNTGTTTPAPSTSSTKKVSVAKRLFKSVVIEVSGPKPFTAYIKYGVGTQLNLQTIQTGLATKHVLELDKKILVPGTTYSYVIVTKDQDGKEEQTAVQTIKTRGYHVKVTVLGKNNVKLKKKKVTLHSDPMTVTTDDDGVASFEDVAPGNHQLEYTVDGKKVTKPIDVADNAVLGEETEEPAPQTFSVVFDGASATTVPMPVILGLVGVVVVLGLIIVLLRSGKLATVGNRFNRPGGPTMGGPTGTTGPMQIGGAGPSGPTTPGSPTDELLNKVPGQSANPGSVIDPNANNNQPK